MVTGETCMVAERLFLLGLLWRRFLKFFGLDLEEGRQHNEKLVNVLPLLVIEVLVGVDCFLRCRIFMHEFDSNLLESLRVRVHYVEELDALFNRVVVIVLLDGDIASANPNHAVFSSCSNLFNFAAQQIRIAFVVAESYDGHKNANKLAERWDVKPIEIVHSPLVVIFIEFG